MQLDTLILCKNIAEQLNRKRINKCIIHISR